MLNRGDHPVAWALLLYQIDDLREHLDDLVKQLADLGVLMTTISGSRSRMPMLTSIAYGIHAMMVPKMH